MKKIVIFSNNFYPERGGLEKNSELLADTISDIPGFKVTILTKTFLSNNNDLKKKYKIIRTRSYLNIFKIISKNDYVLINGGISLPITLLSILLRRPYVPIFQMEESKTNENVLLKTIKRKFYYFGSFCVGVSGACLQSRGIFCLKRCRVIYNPLDPQLENMIFKKNLPDIKDRPIDILFAGRLIEGKGIFILLDALKILEEKSNFKLNVLFSGNGEDEHILKKMVKESKFKKINVSFQNFVGGTKLSETYSKSKCMVLPSHTHKEGCPLSISEAMNHGCIIVHSNQSAMCEQTSEAGNVFSSGNSKKLAQTLEELFFNKMKYNALMQKSLKRGKEFSYSKYRKKIKQLLMELSKNEKT